MVALLSSCQEGSLENVECVCPAPRVEAATLVLCLGFRGLVCLLMFHVLFAPVVGATS